MGVLLAQLHGFGAGVVSAVGIVGPALQVPRGPANVFPGMVHTSHVVADDEERLLS